jgi:hypothetical protein
MTHKSHACTKSRHLIASRQWSVVFCLPAEPRARVMNFMLMMKSITLGPCNTHSHSDPSNLEDKS